ncbi:MAG: ADP-forming succinate--CoA ligase subunit beta [Pedobacter sp.]
MKLHEYQAKALFAQYGIVIPRGQIACSIDEAGQAAASFGGACVLKAQIYAGGRGKAGGVALAHTVEQAREIARGLLHRRLVTAQSGEQGLPVNSLLVEEIVPVARELYLSLTLDRSTGCYCLIASAEGGVDIEQTARQMPERVRRLTIDPLVGLRAFHARGIARFLGLEGHLADAAVELILALYRCLLEKDASLLEINPLVVTGDARLMAMDAKVSIDDSALYRQRDLAGLKDDSQYDPLEVRAARSDIAYIKMDGRIGCLVNGAGLAMATLDMLTECGGQPANFLDVGGGADRDKVVQAFRILLEDPNVSGILVNIFGGIMRCDLIAESLIAAAKETDSQIPIVVRMAGARREEGRKLLEEQADLNIVWQDGLAAAANAIVQLLAPSA